MDAKKFGLFLAQIRKEKNLTQNELAEMLNVTDKAVSRWERGVGLPDINTLEPLARALDISYAEIIQSERKTSDDNMDIIPSIEKIHRLEQIRIIISYFAILFFVEALLIVGAVTHLLVVTRLMMMYVVPVMGLALAIHALCRKKEKLSYKILLSVGLVIFVPLTILFVCDYCVVHL